jgi:DNA-binding PadR family transcriptional regulator
MDNSPLSQDIKDIVDGVRKVITKSISNNPFQSASSAVKPDLELGVMAALSSGAKNGAGVTSHIRLSSAGTYNPSQAQVQSVLESLMEKRFAKIVVREDQRLYELTKAGTAEFESRQFAEPVVEAGHSHTLGCSDCTSISWAPHTGVLAAGARLAQTVAESSGPSHASKHQHVIELIDDTRRRLHEILAEKN